MAVVYDYSEPCEFVRPGEQLEIIGYFELLRHLGVADPADAIDARPTARQAMAIAGWLKDNQPGDLLRDSLNEHGVYVKSRSAVTA